MAFQSVTRGGDHRLQRLKKIYAAVEDYLAGGLLFAGLTLVMVNVILRYNPAWRPKAWIDEYSVYLVVWGTMLGWAVAQRNDHHIKVDMLYNFLPLKVKRWVSVFANTVGLCFAFLFCYYGYLLVAFYLKMGQRTVNTQTPEWIITLVLPVAGLMLAIRFIEKLWLVLKDGGRAWFAAQEARDEDYGHPSAV